MRLQVARVVSSDLICSILARQDTASFADVGADCRERDVDLEVLGEVTVDVLNGGSVLRVRRPSEHRVDGCLVLIQPRAARRLRSTRRWDWVGQRGVDGAAVNAVAFCEESN